MGYWTGAALSKVASAIGHPLHTNRYTTDLNRISYARILIEVVYPILSQIPLKLIHYLVPFNKGLNMTGRQSFSLNVFDMDTQMRIAGLRKGNLNQRNKIRKIRRPSRNLHADEEEEEGRN